MTMIRLIGTKNDHSRQLFHHGTIVFVVRHAQQHMQTPPPLVPLWMSTTSPVSRRQRPRTIDTNTGTSTSTTGSNTMVVNSLSLPLSHSFHIRQQTTVTTDRSTHDRTGQQQHHHHHQYDHHHHHHQAASINTFRYQYQQIRWKGRNDGNRFAATGDGRTTSVRKSTKKKQKQYHRKLQKQQLLHSHHGAPGSKAGLKREYMKREKEEILNNDHVVQDPASLIEQKQKKRYDYADALLDDVMGNSSMTTPTPEPPYIGHRHRYYYNQVVDQMDDYHNALTKTATEQQALTDGTIPTENSTTSSSSILVPTITNRADLPTDEMISKALRAYRDKHGNRTTNAIGIVKGLQHLLYDMQIPVSAIGEYTYTTLLTCCRTPQEGRRILQMIREQGLPITPYSYSILCHLYAKTGDYDGCVNVQQEMLDDKVSPTLASYTSLLAACYKVTNNGRIAHAERIKATKVGWEKWQEMRIIGIEPDVMAYGAILRLKASGGKAEECINLLNEMPRFKVYPTTLCYTTALRAVARSHAIAIRYEKGISRRNRRREIITTHHGKLARQIVIMAEGANIVKDDGFISALCLCAGEAGDVATVKAIYIANEILRTQHDHLRRIGSDEHLARLRGVYDGTDVVNSNNYNHNNNNNNNNILQLEQNQSVTSSMIEQQRQMVQRDGGESEMYEYNEPIIGKRVNGNGSSVANNYTETSPGELVSQSDNGTGPRRSYNKRYIPTYGEREYGIDNRILSSVIHACAQAVNPNMMGSIWQGRENNGYLCLNSLRLIGQPKLPIYTDNSIPGQTIKDNLKFVQEDPDGYREGKRQPRKFAGVDIDENVASTLDDVYGDAELSQRYINPDGRRKVEYRKPTPDEIWRLKYGDDWDKDATTSLSAAVGTKGIEAGATRYNGNSIDQEDDEGIKSYLNTITESNKSDDNGKNKGEYGSDATDVDKSSTPTSANPVGDIYFDYETMRWKPKIEQKIPTAAPQNVTHESQTKKEQEVKANVAEQSSTSVEEELYFDNDTMRWKTRPKVHADSPKTIVSTRSTELDSESDDDDDASGWESVSDDSDDDEDYVFDKKGQKWVLKSEQENDVENTVSTADSTDDVSADMNENVEAEFYYDEKDQEWKTKDSKSVNTTKIELLPNDDVSIVDSTDDVSADMNENFEAELYYDENEQEWKTKGSKSDNGNKLKLPDLEVPLEKDAAAIKTVDKSRDRIDQEADNEKAFHEFYADLRKESLESEQEDVTEEEARELFVMMKDEYNEMIVMTPEELGLEHPHVVERATKSPPNDDPITSTSVQEVGTPTQRNENVSQVVFPKPSENIKEDTSTLNTNIPIEVKPEESADKYQSTPPSQQADTTIEKFWSDAGETQSSYGSTTQTVTFDPSYDSYSTYQEVDESTSIELASQDDVLNHENRSLSLPNAYESSLGPQTLDSESQQLFDIFESTNIQEDYRISRLRELLPNFSDRRLVKIVRCYQESLNDPSLLELVPIVRENMPDYVTSTWLKQQAAMTANFVIQKVAQNELVNVEILNSVLELQTSSGSIDKAVEFHQTEFAAHNMEPTEYSDRLVVQMFLRNSRFNRALSFKQTVESSGRSLDIKSYGSLVEYCARRKQLGSAILLLKECLATHGAPPGEASLSNLRLLCRQAGIEDEIGLVSMIGNDPVEWLRHGERELKREYSKKGRRDVQLARNALVRL